MSTALDTQALTVHDMVWATGGHFLGPKDAEQRTAVVGVSTDTRSLRPGECFVALRGPHFDGHAFVEDAFARGAACAVVSRAPVGTIRKNYIVVGDTTRAYGDIARDHRDRFLGKVVAVTGTNGKTTTKTFIAHVLEAAGLRVHASAKNENNQIGVPKTLLGLTDEHDIAVVEMGSNHKGEIARLAEIAKPDGAVLTNVGPGHLEAFETLDGVAEEKGALLASLRRTGTAFVNFDDLQAAAQGTRCVGNLVPFGCDSRCEVRAEGVRIDATDGRVSFTVDGHRVQLPGVGIHNVHNALAALSVAWWAGVDLGLACAALRTAPLPSGRLEVEQVMGVTVIDDTYNANPASVQSALETLAAVGAPQGRKVAVLGDMLELGDAAEAAHADLGASLKKHGVRLALTVGRYATLVAFGAEAVGVEAYACANAWDAAEVLAERIGPQDAVLVKGSRGVGLERVTSFLKSASWLMQERWERQFSPERRQAA